jgi:hypothetical protein
MIVLVSLHSRNIRSISFGVGSSPGWYRYTLRRQVAQARNEAVGIPNLYVVFVEQPFGLDDGFAIVRTDQLLTS